jgi:hypothetical protein
LKIDGHHFPEAKCLPLLRISIQIEVEKEWSSERLEGKRREGGRRQGSNYESRRKLLQDSGGRARMGRKKETIRITYITCVLFNRTSSSLYYPLGYEQLQISVNK